VREKIGGKERVGFEFFLSTCILKNDLSDNLCPTKMGTMLTCLNNKQLSKSHVCTHTNYKGNGKKKELYIQELGFCNGHTCKK
jgi:hypothetical protein